MVVVEAERLSREEKGRLILNEVSFQLAEGEYVGVLGKNGAGKTTLLRLACGLSRPSGGQVRILGEPVRGAKRLAQIVGVVHQHSGLPELLSVREILSTEVRVRAVSASEVQAVVEVAGLGPYLGARVGELSLGTRRKVSIVKALLHRPRVLFLDEPTAGLDPGARQGIWTYLRALKDGRVSALIASNDLAEAAALCDRALVLRGGTIVGEQARRDGHALERGWLMERLRS